MTIEADVATPYERLLGQVLANRYQIESKIGEGAMGAVYRAKHVKVGRAFAVKVLHSRLLEDPKTLQRFEREAELAGRLRHPNVIGVVDVGETPDGMRYMVMDFAEGPDLATLLDEAPMRPQRVIRLVGQLLEGLFHAHEQGLIHRDFKPENVIVERDSHGEEVPRIVDFGIAILREGGGSPEGPGRLTTNGLVLGTPHYMAPEQAVADPIDHRIDLFALGIMVYEMLCGKLPFDGSGAEVARANLLLDPPPIAERVPYLEVDPLLEAFARRLMAKKRDMRPATAKVARDLLDLIDRDRDAAAAQLGVPIGAAREPMATQPNAPVRHGSGDETFPPPFRGNPTPPQAPPLSTPRAVPAGVDQRRISTEVSDLPKRRVPIIAAAIAGAAVLGIIGFVMLRGDDTQRPAKAAVAEPAPPATEVAPPTETTHEEPAVAAPSAGTETGSATSDDTGSDEAKAVEPDTEETMTQAATAEPAKVAKTAKVTKSRSSGKTTHKATTKAEAKVDTPSPQVAETKQPAAMDARELAAEYQAVGSKLRALEQAKGQDAVSDLWSRYRFIRIADAMSTQQKRDQAAAILAKLTREIAARKK
jgi:serine/threonine-protein kinase